MAVETKPKAKTKAKVKEQEPVIRVVSGPKLNIAVPEHRKLIAAKLVEMRKKKIS